MKNSKVSPQPESLKDTFLRKLDAVYKAENNFKSTKKGHSQNEKSGSTKVFNGLF
ncbi:MAG: hypothetical protein U0V72_07430 [Cytophagales bacterium]